MKNWQSILKDIFVPVVVACIPFAPGIYAKLTEPTLHYVYEVRNDRNPIFEWNRQLSHVLKNIDVSGQDSEKLPAPLLKEIGEEIYKSLPVMLSGAGLHATDSSRVTIVNVSEREIRGVRIHFIGCRGYVSYETYPDSFASSNNPKNNEKVADPVTIRYDKLFPSGDRVLTSAYIAYYGEDTSNCMPTIEAELADGSPAIGKRESIESFINEYQWDKYNKDKRFDLFFRFFLSISVIYMFFQVRKIRNYLDLGD